MDADKTVVQRLAVGRMAFGVAAFLVPRASARLWIGPEGSSKRVAAITRSFAIRDFAVGLGALLALQNDAPVRGWLEAGMLCDAGDVISALLAPSSKARKVILAGAAASGLVWGALALNGAEASG
jgi:hypothetical protein